MNCRCCQSDEIKKFGRFKNRNRIVQRFQCLRCGTTFSEAQPLDGLRVDFKVACQVVHLACESMGVRAISRFSGLHRDTVLSILEAAGQRAAAVLDAKVRNLNASFVEVDEIHSFVFKKWDGDPDQGEFFTFLSTDTSSKLIINSLVGKRTSANCDAFLTDLKGRVAARFQMTTDAWQGYCRGGGSVGRVFGNDIDYATETKVFSNECGGQPTYQTPHIVAIKRFQRIGEPDMKLATTTHAERLNLSVRTFSRRFTRKCLGFSKKLENHKHAVALFAAHFNFCRIHSAHGRTPARAAGLTDHTWTISELMSASV